MPRPRKTEIVDCPIYGLSDRLAQAIYDTGLSKSEICRRAKINRSSLVNYDYGRTPRTYVLFKLAPVLNVSVDWLLGLSSKRELL